MSAVGAGVALSPIEAMTRALALAARGAATTQPNPRVGCVILKDGELVGEGWHQRAGEPHAEVHALRMAGERARGAEVFVTLEPCAHVGRTPPCANALIAAGVAKVYAAIGDPDPRVAGRGFAMLRAAGIAVEAGLCAEQAGALNRGFISRISRARPWLSLKIAASLDGRTAAANGQSQWITGAEARADVHRLRAEAGAVLVGADTALKDDPGLTVRDWAPEGVPLRQPDRIVLDARARVPVSAKVWCDDGARCFWIVGAGRAPAQVPAHVEQVPIAANDAGHIPLADAAAALAARGVNEVLIEAGPRLAGAVVQSGLVDELLLYLAPLMLGEAAQPLALLPGLTALDGAPRFAWIDCTPLGADLRLRARPAAQI